MKGKLALFSMFAALTANNSNRPAKIKEEYRTKESELQKKKKQEELETKLNESKGLKKFWFNNGSLWALNQKSADKKAQKKGWI